MNNLREIKPSKLLEDEAFTYMICSDEKLTVQQGGTNSNIVWDFDFGGFEQPFDNYKVEVLNCGINGFILTANVYLYLVVDGLADSGNFLRKRLSNRQCILSILPMTAIGDSYTQSDGSTGITFNIKNSRVKKRIQFSMVKPDFTPVVDQTDLNVRTIVNPGPPIVYGPDTVTRWFLSLKLTPIIDY